MQAVIFDCDGTLVDSEQIANRVLSECVSELGHAYPIKDRLHGFIGRRLADCLAELEEQINCQLPADFTSIYRQRMAAALKNEVRSFEGVAALLSRISVPICVASSSTQAQIQLSLEITGLDRHFGTRVFSSYQLGSWKPEPDLFIHAARALGAAPEQCVVVEDSLPGILAGIAAGLEVFAFCPGETAAQPPDGVRPFRHFDELHEEFVRRGFVRDALAFG
jgi:HAD superfamily hydrolase (TIGR01509 family)